MIRLSIEGKLKEIQEDRSLKEIAERYADNMKQIVAALVDNEMKNLDYIIEKDAVINWVYRNSADGYRILSRTITLIFSAALAGSATEARCGVISTPGIVHSGSSGASGSGSNTSSVAPDSCPLRSALTNAP